MHFQSNILILWSKSNADPALTSSISLIIINENQCIGISPDAIRYFPSEFLIFFYFCIYYPIGVCVSVCRIWKAYSRGCLWEDPPCLSSSLWSSLLLQLTALSFSSSHACCCIDRSTNNWQVPTKQTEDKPKWDAFTFPYYTLKWLVIWAFTLWKMKRWVEFYFITNSNSAIICKEIFFI